MPTMLQRIGKAFKSAPAPYSPAARRRDPSVVVSDELQHAIKSVSYSQFVADFINDEGTGGINYSEQQVNGAYRSSVYLFAALRLCANMVSTLPIRAESREGSSRWRRLPDDDPLNVMFSRSGRRLMWNMYLYNALYGNVLAYKHKTRRALYAMQRGHPISTWEEGAISGLHTIPNILWQLDEDGYNGPIRGFHVYSQDDYLKNKSYLERWECVYYNDFDPEQKNKGVAIASLAIHDAVSNAAIARWAAHYFMSGAMPLLLVSSANDDPNMTSEADLLRRKNFIERQWQGLWSKFSLRAVFTERKLDVQPVGIKAEDVSAPELDQASLGRICSVVGITPDLIVPPAGGSDNARHKYLIKQAWQQTIIPTGENFLVAIAQDFGLDEGKIRLVIAEEEISALEADRGDVASVEKDLYQAGLETFGEARGRLQLKPTGLDGFLLVNNQLVSAERLQREDALLSDRVMQQVAALWDGDLIQRGEARKMLSLETPPQMPDGFKSQLVAVAGAGGSPSPFGSGGDTGGDNEPPPSTPPPTPPKEPPGEDAPPSKPPPKPTNEPPGEKTPASKPPPEPPKEEAKKDIDPPKALAEIVTGKIVERRVTTAEAQEERLPNPAFIYFDLAEDLLVGQAQRQLQQRYGQELIKWESPATYHITLAYVPDITDEQIEAVRKLLPAYYNRLVFQATEVTTFEPKDGRTPIIALVERDNLIDSIQGAVRSALGAYMIGLSEFSTAEAYTPHVTLGYAPPELIVPDFGGQFALEPKAVCIARGDYQVVERIEIIPDQSIILDVAGGDGGMTLTLDSHADREAALLEIYALRQRWLRALTSGQLDALPDRIRVLVQQCLLQGDFDSVIAAACRAVASGELDDQAVLEGNPVERHMTKSKKSYQDTPEEELDAWQFSALHSGAKALKRFEVKLLPLSVEQKVRTGLAAAKSRDEILGVFSAARDVIREMRPKDTGEDALHAWAEHLSELEDEDLKSVLDFDDD